MNINKRGVTLIELVVLIAIAALITAIFVGTSSVTPGGNQSVTTITTTFPEPTNYAVDAAGVLTPEQLTALNVTLARMATPKHQFGVAIVKSTQPLDITAYGIKLAEKWKVGGKDTDNGAIIIVATVDRQVRIEVGYGLEGDVPDAAAGQILDDQMVPFLKKGDWYGAINSGLNALDARVK